MRPSVWASSMKLLLDDELLGWKGFAGSLISRLRGRAQMDLEPRSLHLGPREGMHSAHLPRKLPDSLETSQESLPALGVAGFQATPIPGGFGTRENLGLNLGSAAYSQDDLDSYITRTPGFLIC